MLPTWITVLAGWLGFTWCIFRVFKEVDDVIKPSVKNSTSKWLKNISVKKQRKKYTWVDSFLGLFHTVFTRKHWTLKCFFKSVLASTVLFFLISLLHYSYTKNNYSNLMTESFNNALDISISGINLRHLNSILVHLNSGNQDVNGHFEIFESKPKTVFRDLPLNDSLSIFGGTYHKKENRGMIQFGCFDKKIGTHIVDVAMMENFYTTYHLWKKKIKENPNSAYAIRKEFNQLTDEIKAGNEEMQLELDYVSFSQTLSAAPILIIYFLIFNFFIDYISLFETRVMIYFLSHSNSIFTSLALLALDFILTLLIFIGIYFVMISILNIGYSIFDLDNKMGSKISSLDYITNPLFIKNLLNFKYPLSIVVYTTFLSSIWIWFFLIGSWIIKFVRLPKSLISTFSEYFDIDNKPFRSIGAMIVLLLSIPFILWEIYLLVS